MPRYIDADALHSMVARALDANEAVAEVNDAVEQEHRVLYWLLEKIEEQTTISPDEVRSAGKWILVDEMNDEVGAHLRYIYCSVCGGFALLEGRFGKEYKSSYCPHCGAKMEVSEDA